MIVKIFKFNGEEITRQAEKFELRRNQVTCWYRLGTDKVERIDDVATIQIRDEGASVPVRK